MERVCADCQTQVDTRRHQAPVQTKVPEEAQVQKETQETQVKVVTQEALETQEAVETQESKETLEEEETLEAVEIQPEGLYRQIIRIRVMKKGKERKMAKITMMKNQMDMVIISMGAQVSTDMVKGRMTIMRVKKSRDMETTTEKGAGRMTNMGRRSTDMGALKTKNTRPQRRTDMGASNTTDTRPKIFMDMGAGRGIRRDTVASEI